MVNPFRYGIVVDDPFFVNREMELKDYSGWLRSGQSLVLYSPRRYGKTSLILKILKNLREEGYNTIYLDFFKIRCRFEFTELYYREIFNKMPSWEKALKRMAELVKGIRPKVGIDKEGLPVISLDYGEADSLNAFQEVLDLPQKLASNKPWIVVFDEFQDVNKFNGDNFEKEMRSAFIHHDRVSYVFMGSQTHMLINMFTHKNRAFHQFAKMVELEKIPETEIYKYLANGFEGSGFAPNDDLLKSIINTADNIPHYVQYLASAVWEAGIEKQMLNEQVLEEAIDKILNNQQDYFMSLYDQLTTYQQRVLVAVEKEPSGIFNEDYKRKHKLSAVSSTQRAVEKLIRKGIIEKHSKGYHFPDPFMRKWLKDLY